MKTQQIIPAAKGVGVSSKSINSNCSVRALANASGISYQKALSVMKEHGFIEGRGAWFDEMFYAYYSQGYNKITTFGEGGYIKPYLTFMNTVDWWMYDDVKHEHTKGCTLSSGSTEKRVEIMIQDYTHKTE